MRLLRPLLLMLGLVFLGVLVVQNDPAAIFAALAGLSWRLAVLAVFPFVLTTAFDTLGWKYAFLRDGVPFRTLLTTRIAGEAFNLTTPTASLGGEAIKAWLLRRHVSLDEAVQSVVVAKTTITVAQGLFLVLGIVGAWLAGLPGSWLLRAMMWLLALEVLAVAAFLTAQLRGVFDLIHRFTARVGLRLSRQPEMGARIDRALATFYREKPGRLVLSITFHFVAWVLGVLEVYLALRFLGVPVSLTTALIIEACGTAVRFATFLVPAGVGAQEGGYVATFVALGLAPAPAVAFGLARRVREIVWILAGFAIFAVMREDARPTLAQH